MAWNLFEYDIDMIAYDLICAQGHAFEGWFDSAQGFEEQQKRGLITCPVCGSSEVEKKLSTFGIVRKRDQAPLPQKKEAPNPTEIVVKFIRDNFQDVGTDFAKEALKMHYGVTEQRNIRGVSSQREEETLKSEGVEFFKLPLPDSSTPEDE